MDIQFIAESSLALAHYVTGYVTKAERSNMKDLWQEISSNKSVYSRILLSEVYVLESVDSMKQVTCCLVITYVKGQTQYSRLMRPFHTKGNVGSRITASCRNLEKMIQIQLIS